MNVPAIFFDKILTFAGDEIRLGNVEIYVRYIKMSGMLEYNQGEPRLLGRLILEQ